MSDATIAAFREAAAACEHELLMVLRRHADALGGPMGQVDALTELLGSVCVAVLETAPLARPGIEQRIMELALYVATVNSRSQ